MRAEASNRYPDELFEALVPYFPKVNPSDCRTIISVVIGFISSLSANKHRRFAQFIIKHRLFFIAAPAFYPISNR